MTRRPLAAFEKRSLHDLSIVDERAFRHIPLYADLKAILVRDKYVFRVLPRRSAARWDRALFLNLTYWDATGGDVLESPRIAADVVAHAAWHHLAALAFRNRSFSAEALFLGESIASAFDVYMVGCLLGRASRSSFLESQVPAMAASAHAAGLGGRAFETLLKNIAADPEGAFAELRRLLFDASLALVACAGAGQAMDVLGRFDSHRFGPLLHHYELSNWVLYARAYATGVPGKDRRAQAVEASLCLSPAPLAWLTAEWVAPRLARRARGGASRDRPPPVPSRGSGA